MKWAQSRPTLHIYIKFWYVFAFLDRHGDDMPKDLGAHMRDCVVELLGDEISRLALWPKCLRGHYSALIRTSIFEDDYYKYVYFMLSYDQRKKVWRCSHYGCPPTCG